MARVRIKQLPITEKTLFSSLVNRNQTEIQGYSFIKDYTNLMKVSINDKKKIKDLTKQLSEGLQLPSEEVHEELSQAKTELQDLHQLPHWPHPEDLFRAKSQISHSKTP